MEKTALSSQSSFIQGVLASQVDPAKLPASLGNVVREVAKIQRSAANCGYDKSHDKSHDYYTDEPRHDHDRD